MTTEERVEKLERDLTAARRRVSWMLAVLAPCVAGLVLLAGLSWTRSNATAVVRARSFVLEDEIGQARANLRVDKADVGLTLLDRDGKPRVALVVADEPGLSFFDERGTLRAGLGLYRETAGLSLADEKGTIRTVLEVLREGSGLVGFDANGQQVWSVP